MDADGSGELTAADVHNIAFGKPPFGERGYNEDDVDDFLEAVEHRLTDPAAAQHPTTADVAAVAFGKPPMGKRGYSEAEVDAFVALVRLQLERLEGAAPAPAPPHVYEEPPRKKWWQIW